MPGVGGMIFSVNSFDTVFHDYGSIIREVIPKLVNSSLFHTVDKTLYYQYKDEEDKWIQEAQSPHK